MRHISSILKSKGLFPTIFLKMKPGKEQEGALYVNATTMSSLREGFFLKVGIIFVSEC